MTSIKKAVRPLLIVALLGTLYVAPSQAALIEIVPSTQTVAPGDTVSADVVLTLDPTDPAVGGFSFELSFDPSILGAPRTFTNDPAVVMGAGSFDASNGFTAPNGSPLDVFFLADVALNEVALRAAEGTGFTLTHVTFTAAAQGLSPLTLSASPTTGVFLSNFTGLAEVPATIHNGSVCVALPGNANRCVINRAPEPGTLLLLASAVLGFLGWRRTA